MKTNLKLFQYYVEAKFYKILNRFGLKRDTTVIPCGSYCYSLDNELNANEPCGDGGYWIKTCKYYRSTAKTKGIACTYIGYFGFDPCLYDQCKICGENEDYE